MATFNNNNKIEITIFINQIKHKVYLEFTNLIVLSHFDNTTLINYSNFQLLFQLLNLIYYQLLFYSQYSNFFYL